MLINIEIGNPQLPPKIQVKRQPSQTEIPQGPLNISITQGSGRTRLHKKLFWDFQFTYQKIITCTDQMGISP